MYDSIISVENLLAAWREFLPGKRRRGDVEAFSLRLTDNIISLHSELCDRSYSHGGYIAFRINDPKPRHIHKASVRDRLLHHAIYRVLYPYFDQKFIFDSFSCRRGKGTHRALNRFRQYGRKVSRNHSRSAWVLKCDIKKFFASVDQAILIRILQRDIKDDALLWLLKEVIGSFYSDSKREIGLPLGNLTSQLLVNIYMNEFDQCLKRVLKVSFYIRYADDFVIMHENKKYLVALLPNISGFLQNNLALSLHPDKVSIRTIASGVDFLGWVHFSFYRIPRRSMKRRMFRKLWSNADKDSLVSYLGLLSHGDTYKLQRKIKAEFGPSRISENEAIIPL